jgi:HPt (histidine-containing phosphotransfer) domain-containing protein
MNQSTMVLFDKTALPSSLGTSENDVLIQFYDIFIQITLESWNDLGTSNKGNDFKLVRQTAHKLKSSSASVGALALADSLKSLEIAAADGNLLRMIEQTEQTTQLLHSTIDLVRAELTSLQQEPVRAW